jgi:hypothetical protein
MAQIDLLLVLPSRLILFECKLTRHASAEEQLNDLYGPLLAKIFPELPQSRIVVFKNPGKSYTPHEEAPQNFWEAFGLEPPVYAELHWIG